MYQTELTLYACPTTDWTQRGSDSNWQTSSNQHFAITPICSNGIWTAKQTTKGAFLGVVTIYDVTRGCGTAKQTSMSCCINLSSNCFLNHQSCAIRNRCRTLNAADCSTLPSHSKRHVWQNAQLKTILLNTLRNERPKEMVETLN
jgi:hypothetical protein